MRYYFDMVATIADFFKNDSEEYGVDLDMPLQVVYKNGQMAYLLDTSAPDPDYMCVIDGSSYLRGIAAGRILSGVNCIVSFDGENRVGLLAKRPEVVGTEDLPAPDTVRLANVDDSYLNRFIALKGAIVSRSGTISQGSTVVLLDDCFGIVTPSLANADAVVTAFVALGRNGSIALRPVSIELSANDPDPVIPTDPDKEGEVCVVKTTVVGDGTLEIFPGCNKHTQTPEGDLLGTTFSVEKNSTVYLYFPDQSKSRVASVVAGTVVVAGDGDEFVVTPYGPMLPLKVAADMTIVVTFVAASGIEQIVSDDNAGSWYDLYGRRLPGRPAAPGIYIFRDGERAAVVRIAM